VPVLKDGEAAIWESHAIVRYLCATYAPGTLCPVEPSERAKAEAWMDWTIATLDPAIMGYFWGFYRTPEGQRDAARNRLLAAESARAIRRLDAWLAERSFLAGDAFSMADVPAGTLMYRYFEMEIERPPAPAVEAWRARLAGRAPYATHVMRPFGELFGRLAY
jgi:glutathione S-transferase